MNERSIFIEALERDDPAEQAAYLDGACGGDTALRTRVEKLLRSYGNAKSFLESPPDALIATIAGAEFAASGEISLDFLEPCEKPGCLGTLGPYEVVEVVGRGGMGVVLRAYDTKLNRVVAIKAIAPELAASAVAVKRFLREARAAAAVNHDHVVTIHAIHDAQQPPLLVMEFIEGQSLQEKLERTGGFDVQEILRIGMQAAVGLAAAHEQGIVHRDIKPANILLENGVERVKITDFGLARAMDDASVTQPGLITGTPQYMSPEQARGEAVDHRSDLFSLGGVLYTMCTGRPPFRAESSMAMLRAVFEDAPRSIREINPEIPVWLEEMIAQLMAKDPGDRIQSAREVADFCRDRLASPLGVEQHAFEPGLHRFNVFQSNKKMGRELRGVHLLFALLCIIQVLGIAGTVVCMAEEIEAAFPMLPLLSIVGLIVAFDGWRIARSWGSIAFGTSTALLAIFFTLVTHRLKLHPSAGDELIFYVALLAYALAAVPLGLFVLISVLLPPEDRWPGRLQFNLRNALIFMAVAGFACYVARFALTIRGNAFLAATGGLFVITVFATSLICIHVVRRLAKHGQLTRPEVWRQRVIVAATTLLLACFGLASLYHQQTNFGYVLFESPVDNLNIERLRDGRVEGTYDTLHFGGTRWHVPVGPWEFRIQGDGTDYTLERTSVLVIRRSVTTLRIVPTEVAASPETTTASAGVEPEHESHHASPPESDPPFAAKTLPVADENNPRDIVRLFKSALLLMTFDEESREDRDGKTFVLDLSTGGNEAVGDDVEFSAEGRRGQALKLRGDNSLRLSRRVLPSSGPFTVAGWFRNERGQRHLPVYREFRDSEKTDLEFRIEDHQLTALRIAFEYPDFPNGGSRAHPFWDTDRPPDGEWYFAAWSHNAERHEFLCVINQKWKVEYSETDLPPRSVEGTASIGLGFRGMIDELAIFNRAFSEHDLGVLYRRGHVGLPANE